MLWTLFHNGGAGMYPLFLLGLAGLAASAYFAARGDEKVRGFIELLCRSLVWAIIGTASIDFMAVFKFLGSDEAKQVPAQQFTLILFEGTFESLSPVAMGSAFLMLTYLFLAIGQRRLDARVRTA